METAPKGPWGPWATLGLFVVVMAGIVAAQTFTAIAYGLMVLPEPSEAAFQQLEAKLAADGLFLSLNGIVMGLVALALTVSFVWFRHGPSARDYLALHAPTNATIAAWLAVAVAFLLATDGVVYWTGHSPVPPWMLEVWASHRSLPLFIVALVMMAPLMEEVVFRGFLYEGLRHSRVGAAGAIVLTSLVWAAIHTQYEVFYVVQIVGIGLLLGVARHRTGTVTVPILMHAVGNGLAMIEVMLKARG